MVAIFHHIILDKNILDTVHKWVTGLFALVMIGWLLYRIIRYPKQSKRFIYVWLCYLFLILGGCSGFYWVYKLFTDGFSLSGFWYLSVIPLTIGSTTIPSFQDETVYPFWERFKKRLTISGYLFIVGGLLTGIACIQDGTLASEMGARKTFIPILLGALPVIIDIYSQTDEGSSDV